MSVARRIPPREDSLDRLDVWASSDRASLAVSPSVDRRVMIPPEEEVAMALDRSEREALIQRCVEGPARLKAALATVPEAALKWRPAPSEWSAHEVICHCADAEGHAAIRIRVTPAIEPGRADRGWSMAEIAALST